jgi:hypothetical protein
VALILAISSGTVFTPSCGLTDTAIGWVPISEIGANALNRSIGILSPCWIGSTVQVEACVM